METSYIYSVSRVNTLAQYLLTKSDIERLLVTEAGAELESALKETYLAPYVLHTKDGDVSEAIEQTLIDAKRLIHRISPCGNLFRVLWVRYDIHNLRVFAKAKAKKLGFKDIEELLSHRGIYEPEYLFEVAEAGSLNTLQIGWQEAFTEAVRFAEEGSLDKVDGVLDEALFATKKRIAELYKNPFITNFVIDEINIFNLRSRLRRLQHPSVEFSSEYIAGGTIPARAMENKDSIYLAFETLAGADFWRSAIEAHKATGNTTEIDMRGREYLLMVAKQASRDVFSSASLVLYYLQCQQSASNVRTIVVGKNSGMSAEEIRANLNFAYVNE